MLDDIIMQFLLKEQFPGILELQSTLLLEKAQPKRQLDKVYVQII